MPAETFTVTVDRAVGGRRLLDHPFYSAWQQGSLTMDNLRVYAEQYRHIEAVLPEVLAAAAQETIDRNARDLIEINLADELSAPAPHLELFDRFAAAVGAEDGAEATPATSRLVRLYRQAAADGAVPALAVIAAYETQAADIASTKADSLRRHYGLDRSAVEFWDVHARMETDHASWTLDALDSLAAEQDRVECWVECSAGAWWAFLDEREACRV